MYVDMQPACICAYCFDIPVYIRVCVYMCMLVYVYVYVYVCIYMRACVRSFVLVCAQGNKCYFDKREGSDFGMCGACLICIHTYTYIHYRFDIPYAYTV